MLQFDGNSIKRKDANDLPANSLPAIYEMQPLARTSSSLPVAKTVDGIETVPTFALPKAETAMAVICEWRQTILSKKWLESLGEVPGVELVGKPLCFFQNHVNGSILAILGVLWAVVSILVFSLLLN
ncbi:hypothetical protein POUND7_006872 [Theobroma cacao]